MIVKPVVNIKYSTKTSQKLFLMHFCKNSILNIWKNPEKRFFKATAGFIPGPG